jgi:hypothetical protein
MSGYGGGGGGMMQQPVQNFNSMPNNLSNPMGGGGGASDGMGDMFQEPEAANGALGGSSWSSW